MQCNNIDCTYCAAPFLNNLADRSTYKHTQTFPLPSICGVKTVSCLTTENNIGRL